MRSWLVFWLGSIDWTGGSRHDAPSGAGAARRGSGRGLYQEIPRLEGPGAQPRQPLEIFDEHPEIDKIYVACKVEYITKLNDLELYGAQIDGLGTIGIPRVLNMYKK